jgi:hypothetical protein
LRRRPVISRLLLLLVVLVLASVMLAPVMMAFEFDPMPGDIAFTLNQHHYQVPVLWSLCAGAGLALLYSMLRK